MKARKFKKGAVNHVYQRTINRFNIFYDIADYLVYFTIFCTFAREAKISVWSLCLMIDHIHTLIESDNLIPMSEFISRVTSVFVRVYNKYRGRKGPLFEKRFGSAPKSDIKKLISSIIYVGNNPVEKRICSKAELYRWNFIAYIDSDHPFSEKLIIGKCSTHLARAVRVVNTYAKKNLYLDYGILDGIFSKLSPSEKKQLIDYIIVLYNAIDYKKTLEHFETYEQLTTAMRSTTGSEYDLKEETDRSTDSVYRDCINEVKHMGITDIRKIVCLSINVKLDIANRLRQHTNASIKQICKFLHILVARGS